MHPGLCKSCVFSREVANRGGSIFWLCEAHHDHPGMPKYPVLPVLRCLAFRPAPQQVDSQGEAEVEDGK